MQPDTTETKVVTPTTETKTQETSEPSHDPVKQELEKVTKGKKTELEKAVFTAKSTLKRIKDLGGNPDEILNEAPVVPEDENTPVTVGMLRRRDAETSKQTSLQMAETIEDESERELTKYHLSNTIRPSGNPDEDVRNARALVNSVKNGQIVQETMRGGTPKSHSSGSGAPVPITGKFEPTPEELGMLSMKGLDGKPLLTLDDIKKARQ